MTELHKALCSLDDEYLTAISNKGIFKRACSDLEKINPTIENISDSEMQIKVGEEQCTITLPVTSCSCTCPSTSICRHIITALLYAKTQISAEDDGSSEPHNHTEKTASIIQFLKTQSIPELKRAAGKAVIKKIISNEHAGKRPKIEDGAVITVYMEGAVVRLIDSPESSVCSCHSQLLCNHKAEAALWLMLRENIITVDDIDDHLTSATHGLSADMLSAAGAVADMISGWLSIGLCRLDDSAAQQAEQLAIICHNARLAGFERRCRTLANMISAYNTRSALLKSGEIKTAVFSLYHDAVCLPTASLEYTERIIGEFKEIYTPVDTLDLALISERSFTGRSGYDGTVYYFFECTNKKWYTLVAAKPTFYDTKKRRSSDYQQVWDLDFELNKLYGKRFLLKGAKASGEKLSTSAKARTQLNGDFTADESTMSECVIYDFRILADMLIGNFEDIPVIVAPARIISSEFKKTDQRYLMIIEDSSGTQLNVSLKYSAQDDLVIKTLERLADKKDTPPLILGTLYIHNGHLTLYPIDLIARKENDL